MKHPYNKFTYMDQGNRTQQLIYRTSYRKHRERLADIRHNITANEFLHPKVPIKPYLKEGEGSNTFLRSKGNATNNRNSSKIQQLFLSEQSKKQSKRYVEPAQEDKMQVITDLNNGENIKFVLPSTKHNSFTVNMRKKDPKNQIISMVSKESSAQKGKKKYTSFSILKESRDLKANKQMVYDLPQRNEARIVVYKKTLILNSMQSCLIQLSLISERLLVVAYLMGQQNGRLKELFQAKRTSQLLRQYDHNYQDLCSKIVIEKIEERYRNIRLQPKEQEKEKITSEEDKIKQKAKIQNQFLKRNYYTLPKTDEEQRAQSQQQKVSSVSYEHIQAVVDRLAAPKRLSRLRSLEKPQRHKVLSEYSKQHNEQSRQELAIKIVEAKPNTQEETPMRKLKQPQAKQFEGEFNLPHHKVEQNQNQEEQYQQEFDNPSEIKQKNSSLQLSKQNTNLSKKLHQKIGMNQHSLKNESQVYQNQFQKQQRQGQISVPAIKHEKKGNLNGNEQEYQEQFEN